MYIYMYALVDIRTIHELGVKMLDKCDSLGFHLASPPKYFCLEPRMVWNTHAIYHSR